MPVGRPEKGHKGSPEKGHKGNLDSVYMNTISSTLKKRDSKEKLKASDISTSITRPHQIQGLGLHRNSIGSVRHRKTDDPEMSGRTQKKTAVLDEEIQELKSSKKTVEISLQLAHEQNGILKSKAEELEQELDTFKLENEHLKESTNKDQTNVVKTTTRVKELELQIDKLTSKVKRRDEHIKKLRMENSDKNGVGPSSKNMPAWQKAGREVRQKPDRSDKSQACVIS